MEIARMIEECGKKMQQQLQMRDDLISLALKPLEDTISSEVVIQSTKELALMTKSISELSILFRKMVEKQGLIPPCDNQIINPCIGCE